MRRAVMLLAVMGLAACGSSQRQAASPPKPSVALDATTESTSTTTAPPPTTTTTLPPPTTAPPTAPPVTRAAVRSTATAAQPRQAVAPVAGGFQACVALRESGNNPHIGGGLYGILDSTWHSLGYGGHARDASVAQQNEAFARLYARFGTAPWAPYDGC